MANTKKKKVVLTEEQKLEKKQFKFSKMIVTAIIVLNILFSSAVLYIFYKTGSEPSILIGSFFTFTCTELVNLCVIKKSEK